MIARRMTHSRWPAVMRKGLAHPCPEKSEESGNGEKLTSSFARSDHSVATQIGNSSIYFFAPRLHRRCRVNYLHRSSSPGTHAGSSSLRDVFFFLAENVVASVQNRDSQAEPARRPLPHGRDDPASRRRSFRRLGRLSSRPIVQGHY